MNQLNKRIPKTELLKNVVYETYDCPERVIQFGEGNFLRGFLDWMIHEMNKQGLFNGKVVAIQPTPHGKVVPKLNAQNGMYTLSLKGIEEGKIVEKNEIISSISRGINPYTNWGDVLKLAASSQLEFVFSNTTEAGLTYLKEEYNEEISPLSFPGKLTAFLYERYKVMNGSREAGLVIIPCELVEDNGNLLRDLVLKIANDWNLPIDFQLWIKQYNQFCNTLVDRIVTGYPTASSNEYRELLGYKDELLTVGEPYHLFAIDADQTVADRLPLLKANINVKWGDVTPYRELKVRLLNGPHTMMFAASYLSGVDTVLDAMEDPVILSFIKQGLYDEILPNVRMSDLEKRQFTDSVIERFINPFNRHLLTDIGMNAVNKFKVRLLPSLLEYKKENNCLPKTIVFSLAALIVYYRPTSKDGSFLIGKRKDDEYTIRDSDEAMNLFATVWEGYDQSNGSVQKLVNEVFMKTDLWGLDLSTIDKLNEEVVKQLELILKNGMKESVQRLID